MKYHSIFKIMLRVAIVLVLVLTTAATCFAGYETQWPFQAEVFVNGNSIGTCGTIQEFNQLLVNNPGSGDMVVKAAEDVYWALNKQIVIPKGAEYNISFDITEHNCYLEPGCSFKIEADNVTIDFDCKLDLLRNFLQNENGGLVYVTGNNVTIKNLYMSNLSAKYYGGAIYTEGNNTTIENCGFTDCTAGYYGGAIYAEKYGCKVNGCTFTGCTANGGWAGAIYLNYGGKSEQDRALIENCKFDKCSANGGHGEALFIGDDYTHVKGCEFYNTTVTSDICYVGNSANVNIRFENCKFYNNEPADGYDEFIDIWGTRSTTVVSGCSSDNPSEDKFYSCTGSFISEGNLGIIIVLSVLALGGIVAVVIVNKKKKFAPSEN